MKTRIRKLSPSKAIALVHLADARIELQRSLSTLKSLGCMDTDILVEFWLALDTINEKGGSTERM